MTMQMPTEIVALTAMSIGDVEAAAGSSFLFADDVLAERIAAANPADAVSKLQLAAASAALLLGRFREAGMHEADTPAERIDYELTRGLLVQIHSCLDMLRGEN